MEGVKFVCSIFWIVFYRFWFWEKLIDVFKFKKKGFIVKFKFGKYYILYFFFVEIDNVR